MPPTRALRSLGCLVLAIQLGGPSLAAQKTGLLLGIVGDTTGRPLVHAEVLALRAKRLITTDSLGIFRIKLPAGEETFVVRRAGFITQTFDASVVAGDSTRVGVILDREPVTAATATATSLPDLVVQAEGVSYRDKMTGFGNRLRNGGIPRSNFMTRKDIEASGLTLTVDLLMRTGLSLRADLSPEKRMSSKRSKLICPRGPTSIYRTPRTGYFVDGTRMNDDFDVNFIDISEIAAIEVYHSAVQMPIQYNSLGYGCIVLLWLRDARDTH